MVFNFEGTGSKTGWSNLMNMACEFSGRRMIQAARFALNILRYRKFKRSFSKTFFRKVAEAHPAIPFKFTSDYLANFLSTKDRLDIIANHYAYLESRFTDHAIRVFPATGITLWSMTQDPDSFSIRLGITDYTMMEGEKCLHFTMNGKLLFTISFTIMPGERLGIDAHQVIFIGGSQGAKGSLQENRYAAKAMGEISPATMLLIGLQALGQALGIETLVGVSTKEHITPSIHQNPENHVSSYDALWTLNGGEPLKTGFRMAAAISTKPSTSTSFSHRARAKRKRARKQEFFDEIRMDFTRYLHMGDETLQKRAPKPEDKAFSLAPVALYMSTAFLESMDRLKSWAFPVQDLEAAMALSLRKVWSIAEKFEATVS